MLNGVTALAVLIVLTALAVILLTVNALSITVFLCPSHCASLLTEKECGKFEKELAKIKKKFMASDESCAALENEALVQRKELLRVLQTMQVPTSLLCSVYLLIELFS